MATLRVNPNRMELLKLKRRTQVARRGHKLLKDKLDELVKEFVARFRAVRRLRSEVEAELAGAYALFSVARAEAGSGVLAQALMAAPAPDPVEVTERDIMSVKVPEVRITQLGAPGGYSLLSTPAVLDDAIARLATVAPRLIELAEREKALELLAAEIERTRRRVNALEHVLIPQLVETVRHIQMKLDENERSNLTRLMKVKDMVAAKNEAERAARDEQ